MCIIAVQKVLSVHPKAPKTTVCSYGFQRHGNIMQIPAKAGLPSQTKDEERALHGDRTARVETGGNFLKEGNHGKTVVMYRTVILLV